jgi:hypothetical protein
MAVKKLRCDGSGKVMNDLPHGLLDAFGVGFGAADRFRAGAAKDNFHVVPFQLIDFVCFA